MRPVPLVAARADSVYALRASVLLSTVIVPPGYVSDMGDFLSMARYAPDQPDPRRRPRPAGA
ncbi:hypothetical protein [Antarctobacter heliothermus]|uniref:hypothetical protein n=1 Tax=Antarctobacter heliothermus TaxID=74033 RepID=UPI000B76CE2F|nr:hypothetical protein [Antarctobacter heliothermus]